MDDIAKWIEQQAEPAEIASLVSCLQAWSDEHGKPPKREPLWVISESTVPAQPPAPAKTAATKARASGEPHPKRKTRSKA
jgi:hypothetical protein